MTIQSNNMIIRTVLYATLLSGFGQSVAEAHTGMQASPVNLFQTRIANHFSNNIYVYGAAAVTAASIVAFKKCREYLRLQREERRTRRVELEQLGFGYRADAMSRVMTNQEVSNLSTLLLEAGFEKSFAKKVNKIYSTATINRIAFLATHTKIPHSIIVELAATFTDQLTLLAIKKAADQGEEKLNEFLKQLALEQINAEAVLAAARTTVQGLQDVARIQEFWRSIFDAISKIRFNS